MAVPLPIVGRGSRRRWWLMVVVRVLPKLIVMAWW